MGYRFGAGDGRGNQNDAQGGFMNIMDFYFLAGFLAVLLTVWVAIK